MQQKNQEEIAELITGDHACYVLITCGHPDRQGRMDVEMVYEGDPTLASYILRGAQNYIEEHDETLVDGTWP